jgi:hypothetical protein
MTDYRDNRGITLVGGQVLPEVYVAIRSKHLNHGNFSLHVMDRDAIRKYAQHLGYRKDDSNVLNKSSASLMLCGIDQMTGQITYVENCGKFFFQPKGEKYDSEMRFMRYKMKVSPFQPIQNAIELSDQQNVVIKYNQQMERAQVIKQSKDETIQFNLIDLGIIINEKEIKLNDIAHCAKPLRGIFELPPKCFQVIIYNEFMIALPPFHKKYFHFSALWLKSFHLTCFVPKENGLLKLYNTFEVWLRTRTQRLKFIQSSMMSYQ